MAPATHFPDPLVVPPLSSHKQTFILLHGRGSSAAKFGPALLSTAIPAGVDRTADPLTGSELPGSVTLPPGLDPPPTTLATLFPHAKFIFPTAPRSRATAYKRSIINQWFDCSHIHDNPDRDPWLMIDGLQQTTTFLHDLLKQEAELIGGPENLVLGGLSQGCAASLVAALLWEGGKLGAVVGMCGWLPFKGVLETAAGIGGNGLGGDGSLDDVQNVDPFESSPVETPENGLDLFERPYPMHIEGNADPCAKAIFGLREEIELQGAPSLHGHSSITTTPVFLGHGVDDEKVPAQLGQESAECLEALGIPIYWHEYQGLGHWYSEAMLADLVHFLQGHTGWEIG